MRVSILSDAEIQTLLTYLTNCPPRDALIIRFMLQCGLRAGEVKNLNVGDVWRSGLPHPAINLRQGTTKGHIARYVDMPAPVSALLSDYIKIYYSCEPHMSNESPLFLSYGRSKRLGVRDVERITDLISSVAIGRRVHPHLLRHTYATVLLRYTNIRVVQTLLGHANISTTQVYTHVSSEDCKNAVNQAFTR